MKGYGDGYTSIASFIIIWIERKCGLFSVKGRYVLTIQKIYFLSDDVSFTRYLF